MENISNTASSGILVNLEVWVDFSMNLKTPLKYSI